VPDPPPPGGHPDDRRQHVVVGRQGDRVDARPPERRREVRLAPLGRLPEPSPERRILGVDYELLARLGVVEENRPDIG
jgi:hypothetical protein